MFAVTDPDELATAAQWFPPRAEESESEDEDEEEDTGFQNVQDSLELTQVLKMYLTRLVLEMGVTLLSETGRLLRKLHLAMITPARCPRRCAEELTILSTRGRPAKIPGAEALRRHLPRNIAAGRH